MSPAVLEHGPYNALALLRRPAFAARNKPCDGFGWYDHKPVFLTLAHAGEWLGSLTASLTQQLQDRAQGTFDIVRTIRPETQRQGIMLCQRRPWHFDAYCECLLARRGADLLVTVHSYVRAHRTPFRFFFWLLFLPLNILCEIGAASRGQHANMMNPPQSPEADAAAEHLKATVQQALADVLDSIDTPRRR